MKIFVVLLSFLLASVSLASNDNRTNSENADVHVILAAIESAHTQMIEVMDTYRIVLTAILNSLGADIYTVAELRERWTREGKHHLINHYLTGRQDKSRVWFLMSKTADHDKMTEFGLGDVRIGYIEQWQWFNKLTDAHNSLTKAINAARMEQLRQGIRDLRKRIEALNCDLDDMNEDLSNLKTQTQTASNAVSKMLHRVETQNLGLQMLLAYQRAIIDGLGNLSEAMQGVAAVSSNL